MGDRAKAKLLQAPRGPHWHWSREPMGSIAFACLQLVPIIIYVCYAYTLLFVGAYALAEDYAVSDHACGKTYHLWKFCCINSLLCFFTCLSYCVWRGGGEGARARAMVLTMLYFGFFMWGLLLWQRMSPACSISS